MRAVIPPNFDDNGGVLGGLVRKKNAVEAGVFLAISMILFFLALTRIGSIFLSAVLLMVAICGSAFFAIGIGDESVISFVISAMRYRRKKEVATLMMPSDNLHD